MKIQEIREIIKLVDGSSIDEFTYEAEGTKVKIKKNAAVAADASAGQPVSVQAPEAPKPAAAPAAPQLAAAPQEEGTATESAPAAAAQQEDLHQILSPMVGTFYQSPSPEEEPYVQTGTKVTSDQVVCIVEAMKLFNEIEAEVDGEIAEILVKDGQLVEYGQPLFLVKTN